MSCYGCHHDRSLHPQDGRCQQTMPPTADTPDAPAAPCPCRVFLFPLNKTVAWSGERKEA